LGSKHEHIRKSLQLAVTISEKPKEEDKEDKEDAHTPCEIGVINASDWQRNQWRCKIKEKV
jgi:hypothetical protein